MKFLGIDPGMEGAAAIYRPASLGVVPLLEVLDLPTSGDGPKRRINAPALAAWIRQHNPDHAFIEMVGSFPGQGIASAFRFGRAAGAIEATVACCNIPFTLVAPISWKKYFGLKGPDKEPSRQMAIQRMPYAASLFTLKKHHQRAEAALLALYGTIRNAG